VTTRLRVLDFGTVGALASQAVYHGIALAMRADDDPVLTLVNPSDPYICVGLHQEIALEVDEAYCQAHQLPIVRRHVGGGAVYLDRHQMFFHFIFPHRRAPSVVAELYPMFIEPVVRTYQTLGVNANFRPVNDIHVNGRKIGGTGAARIGDATVMVGSFMFDFDIDTMALCLKVPSEKFRDKLRTGLKDYITTLRKELATPPTREQVKKEFLRQIAHVFQLAPLTDVPNAAEKIAITEQERALSDPEWTYQTGRKFVQDGVKIAADTHLTETAFKAPGGLIRVQLLAKDDRIAGLHISGDFTVWPNDGMHTLAALLHGVALDGAALERAIQQAISTLQLQIPGVEAAHLSQAILAAVHHEPK